MGHFLKANQFGFLLSNGLDYGGVALRAGSIVEIDIPGHEFDAFGHGISAEAEKQGEK